MFKKGEFFFIYLPIQKITMNEILISFKIVSMALNIFIPASILSVETF